MKFKTYLVWLLIGSFTATGLANAPTLEIVRNAQSAYAIGLVRNADSLEQKAAAELQAYLFKISGATLPIKQVKPGTKGKWIFIGHASSLETQASYAIISQQDALHIRGKTARQTLESVYIFLEKHLDCTFLAPGAEYIPKRPTIRIRSAYQYSPDIQVRTVHSSLFYDNPDFAAKRAVSTEAFPSYVPEARVHTFNHFLPQNVFYQEHPEYYALVHGRRLPTQLCLSNDTVFQIVRDSVAAMFKRYPEATILSVSQDDNTQYCTCSRCAATDTKAESPAGSMIQFVNRVAEVFPDKVISTLAYQYTRKAPKGIKPAKNVLVTLCSIECDRSAPIQDKCPDFEQDLQGWSEIGATVGIWDYTTQFTNFLAPFPNLHTLQPNIRLFQQHNTRWVFEQHSHRVSELFELRSYLLSTLLWEPSASVDSLTQRFITRYYGEAAAPFISQYVQTIHEALASDTRFFLFLYGDPSQAFGSYLNAPMLKKYDQWFDMALDAVGTDATLRARIQSARLGVDFAMLEYYRKNTPAFPITQTAQVQALLQRFEESCRSAGATLVNEMGLTVATYIEAYTRQIERASPKNRATGATVLLMTKPKKYAEENPLTLTDGAFGGWSFFANWLGFEGNDLEAIVDLGSTQPVHRVSMSFLQVVNHVVFFPESVAFYLSENGQDFELLERIPSIRPLTPKSQVNDIQDFKTGLLNSRGRYIKVKATNIQTAPIWHHAAGLGAWIFADELVVE